MLKDKGSLIYIEQLNHCLLYTSDAADDSLRVDLGGRRIIKKKNFFKQKTAYEISACLVGSEMCIRDRVYGYGQKDYRGNNTIKRFCVWTENGFAECDLSLIHI